MYAELSGLKYPEKPVSWTTLCLELSKYERKLAAVMKLKKEFIERNARDADRVTEWLDRFSMIGNSDPKELAEFRDELPDDFLQTLIRLPIW